MPSATLRVLLAELIDYAGLFPPAAQSMADAVKSYAEYRSSPDAWALGRFVVPAARLDELAAAAERHAVGDPWHISALAGDDLQRDAESIRAWNAAHHGRFLVDAIEFRASTADSIANAARAFGAEMTIYAEIPIAEDPQPLIAAIAHQIIRAKVRTGGVETSAFPPAQHIARFILRCSEAGVAFKATAGLHHPLRAAHRLTYAEDAPRGMMFGFLNVFAAAALARAGALRSVEDIVEVLEERDAVALSFGDDTLRWRSHTISLDALDNARTRFAIAFGSCSFREPIDDLQHLHLL